MSEQPTVHERVVARTLEKKGTPLYQLPKLLDLSRRIAELTEKWDELRSEKEVLLNTLDYTGEADAFDAKEEIFTMVTSLKKLEELEAQLAIRLGIKRVALNQLKAV